MNDQLGYQPAEDVAPDWEAYRQEANTRPEFTLPDPGVYTATLPVAEDAIQFRPNKRGHLMAVIDPITIITGDGKPTQVRYEFAAITPYREGENPSRFGDLLIALGSRRNPRTREEWEQALLEARGANMTVSVDWEAYCRDCSTSVNGSANFPIGEDGKPKATVPCPSCQKALRGRLRIRRYLPAR